MLLIGPFSPGLPSSSWDGKLPDFLKSNSILRGCGLLGFRPALSSKLYGISLVTFCVSDQVVRPSPFQGGGINPNFGGRNYEGFVAIGGFLCGGSGDRCSRGRGDCQACHGTQGFTVFRNLAVIFKAVRNRLWSST